ncbi:MAG: carboxypeptidase-like regulatory domain-containing protein [Acidobacteriota bacterium]
MPRQLLVILFALSLATVLAAQTSRPGPAEAPARDTPAQAAAKDVPPAPMGRITGRVLAADNGRPVRRARAVVNAAELPGGRATLTDDSGVFELTDLPAGRYTLSVSKTGFVGLSYGQRRPLQAGTPLQLREGQQMAGIEFRLPRGSVLAGHIFDETGEPMPGASVRVMRYQYAQGERQLVPAGNTQTDDEGTFRVWGLNPGDYYVSAVTRNFDFGGRGGPGGGRGGGPGSGPGGRGGGRGGPGRAGFIDPVPPPSTGDDETEKAYAPTYYPGVGSISEARPISVSVGQQLLDINFNLLLVRTARITGVVTNPNGTETSSGQVNLAPEAAGAGSRGQLGVNFNSRIDWDGKFILNNVPPGRYVLRARGDDAVTPQYAAQPLTVDSSGDISDVSVLLYPSASVTGVVTFEGGQGTDLTQVRITAPSAEDAVSIGANPNARVDKEGTFTLNGVAAGLHWIRSGGGARGWALKSVIVDGVDVVDTPIALRSGQTLQNVSVVFTNKLTEINGTVTDVRGTPLTEFTVLAFPTESLLWRPLARQIATARPDQNGRFQMRGLPPGSYYLATVDPAEQGEWFEPAFLEEHRIGAARISLSEGAVQTSDFQVATR